MESDILRVVSRGDILSTGKTSSGFFYVKDYSGYILQTSVEKYDGESTTDSGSTYSDLEQAVGLDTEMVSTSDSSLANSLLTDKLLGIYGMPYQFMSNVDRRVSGTNFGRKYAEKIVSRMPLLFLTPGKQSFMTEFSKEDQRSVLERLIGSAVGQSNESDINQVLEDTGRYYTFEFDYKNYFNYVNPMCWSTAKLLGVANEKITIGNYTAKLGSFNWSKALNSDFKSYFSASENIVFYVNSNTSISETFSNETRESSLVSGINGLSDTTKEINFILGATTGNQIAALNSDNYEATMSSINSVVDGYLNGSSVLKGLAGNFTTVLSGGKMVFPELWSDSDFARSYDIDIKLRSPDRDKLSIYLNIIVPYIHLIAMTAPRQLNANGYSAPFLVRAFYKGLFNIDMGIITNLSVTKGKEMSWTDDGIPSEIDISMSIKDLYSSLFLTSISNPTEIGKMVNNTSLMDYLSTMVGLNLSKPEIGRKLSIYSVLLGGSIRNIPSNLWTGFDQNITNMLQGLYNW